MLDLEGPIGVFDSGLGGLSVLPSIRKLLPFESLFYYGDSARAPYGVRSLDEVRILSYEVGDYLMEQGAKAIVVACNTATSAAVIGMRKRYSVPVIGMEPAIKPAIEQTATGAVAVLATELTLKEEKFQLLVEKFAKTTPVIRVPSPHLVGLVESGCISGPEAEAAVDLCFKDMDISHLGSIVLGCTHFVFLKDVFQKRLGNVRIFDGNLGTAKQLKRQLSIKGLLSKRETFGTVRIENSGGKDFVDRSWALLDGLLD